MPSSTAGPERAPVDPDVDLHDPSQRNRRAWDPAVLAVIALGAVIGAQARYGLSLWWPSEPGRWPVSTWWINLSGSFLLGSLMVVLVELRSPSRLARPFIGVGMLGGYTTFSTAMVESHELVLADHPGTAMAYLFGTAAAALAAVAAGSSGTRVAIAGWRRIRRSGRS